MIHITYTLDNITFDHLRFRHKKYAKMWIKVLMYRGATDIKLEMK